MRKRVIYLEVYSSWQSHIIISSLNICNQYVYLWEEDLSTLHIFLFALDPFYITPGIMIWVKELCPILCLQYCFRNHHIEIHWDKKVPKVLGEAGITITSDTSRIITMLTFYEINVDFLWKKKFPLWKMGGLIKRGKETLKEDGGRSVDKRDHRIWEQIMRDKKWS